MCARCKLRAKLSLNPTPGHCRETAAAEMASLPNTSPSSGPFKSHLCVLCGCEGKKKCNKCLKKGVTTYYCGRECQLSD